MFSKNIFGGNFLKKSLKSLKVKISPVAISGDITPSLRITYITFTDEILIIH